MRRGTARHHAAECLTMPRAGSGCFPCRLGWHDRAVGDGTVLEVNADLFRALTEVLGDAPTAGEPVVLVAAYVYWLSEGYGLSESQNLTESQYERANPPSKVRPLLGHYIPEANSGDVDGLRRRLYATLIDLADDADARKILNKSEPLSEVGLLKVAQVFWNLEAGPDRPRLPITANQQIVIDGRTTRASIRVPEKDGDYATMKRTDRTNVRLSGLGVGRAATSSGQSLRDKGARLAVLVAQRFVDGSATPPPAADGAILDVVQQPGRTPRAIITWPEASPHGRSARLEAVIPPATAAPQAAMPVSRNRALILVGPLVDVAPTYQRRDLDDELDRLWADGGDRRLWLRGGPGLGKTYAARRVMRDAVTRQGIDREDLLVWVDSADPDEVRRAYSTAVDRMPQAGHSLPVDAPDRTEGQAQALLEVLARSTWRWLIVLDNADASGLIEAGLIPTGANPNGRVLVTTRSRDQRVTGSGRVVVARPFTPAEGEGVVRAQVDPNTGGPARLARATDAEVAALTSAVDLHPLALSIAAATIVSNAMDVQDWVAEFATASSMDAAADAPDPGGYGHLIGATWRVALEKASSDLPQGQVERAAMVAALQDPDGHPTWLWDCEAVLRWVADGPTPVRRHRMPTVVERLVDVGVLEMRGSNWKNGTVAIHRLAARAVREQADPAELGAVAAVLVKAWLLHLTEREAGTRPALRRNVETLDAVSVLTGSTKQAVVALRGFAVSGAPSYAWELTTKGAIAPYLEKGGVTGQALIAHQLAVLGNSADELDLREDARANYTQAAQIYEGLIASPAVHDSERADHLHAVGKLYEKLGRIDLAHQALAKALAIYERALEADSGSLGDVVAVMQVHRSLGTRSPKATTERVAMEIDAMIASGIGDAGVSHAWEALADDLRELGLLHEAARLQSIVVEASCSPGAVPDRGALRKLARIRAEAGEWEDAADALSQIVAESGDPDDLVRLASIQVHLGRAEEAEGSIARAAELYTTGERDHASARPRRDPSLDGRLLDLSLQSAAVEAMRLKRWGDAAGLYEGLVDLHQEQAARDPGAHESSLASSSLSLGLANLGNGRPDDAVGPLTRAARSYQMLVELDPDDEKSRSRLRNARILLVVAHVQLGRPEEAIGDLTGAMELIRETPDPDVGDRQALESFATDLETLGAASSQLGQLDSAAYCYARLVAVRLMTEELAPRSADALKNSARAEYELGSIRHRLGELDSATDWLRYAVDHRQELADLDPDDPDAQQELAQALHALGLIEAQLEHIDEAEQHLNLAVDILRRLADSDPGQRDTQRGLASALSVLGYVLEAAGRSEQAVECLGGATNIFLLLLDLAGDRPAPEVIKATIMSLSLLAEALRNVGHLDGAEAASMRARGLAERFPDADTSEPPS